MERINFWKHKDKMIIFFDFSGCKEDEFMKTLEDARSIVRRLKKDVLLTLVDVTNTESNDRTNRAIKEFAAENKPYVKAGAVVGVFGLKKLVYQIVMKFTGRNNLKLFNTVQEAKDWLATQ
ncbi:MAG: hypothetical protein H5U39_06585 [Deferribacterales bacterium]|jgi:hypothetical protein|uniref:hypothetical protein n=1 Tax=Deferrivibrio essentukiensis TaxID=2880922 RepID=UPI0019AA5384|nr:hypothetical protein [Deferrivibrio essentukiensis]MBC7196902.1 hypothetical protein [Deferribacterales bacterium]MCB4205205.1 hypothetical protein [Deferrivibrio essentukiensis]